MRTLVAKEIRLLLPTFITALLLAVVPIWFFQGPSWADQILRMIIPLLCFGSLLMALTSFGREFGMGTFPLLLSLPFSRARIWWIKVAILGCAMAVVFGAAAYSWTHWNSSHRYYTDSVDGHRLSLFEEMNGKGTFVVMAVVIFVSGLWTTLLLRQIVAAFWFAVLVPAVILTVISWNGGSARMVEIAMGIYSVTGFLWAWRQFNQAQEVGWTGGEVNLPEWRSTEAGARQTGRAYRPLAALIWKEVQLYQVALLGMAGLFVVHLGIIAVRKALHTREENTMLEVVLNMFGGLWLIVPLITGGLNVADERRLGTMESHLCLPISTRKQFTIKLLVVLLFSGLLSAFLLWLAEGIGGKIGAGAWMGDVKISLDGEGLPTLTLMFLAISLIVFYASTLSRNILQAIMVAVITAIGLAVSWGIIEIIFRRHSSGAFQGGNYAYAVGWPVAIVSLLWLGYGNFRGLVEARRVWLRNVGGLALATVFAGTVIGVVFNRAWEFLTPLEPAHGPARIPLAQAPMLNATPNNVAVLLPDGRFWWDRQVWQPGRAIGVGKHTVEVGGKYISPKGNHFVDEANWVAVEGSYWESAAIRADGTLWASDSLPRTPRVNHGQLPTQAPVKMVQVGADADWKKIVRVGYRNNAGKMALLKTDGTLWSWGTNDTKRFVLLAHIKPQRLGSDSDWSDIVFSGFSDFAWKTNGQAWRIETDPGFGDLNLRRWPQFDNFKWRNLAGAAWFVLAVRDDGTLWTFSYPVLNGPPSLQKEKPPAQVGTDTNWISVMGNNRMFIALKSDGALWKWDMEWNYENRGWLATKPPTRLGKHNDWVAIDGGVGSLSSLAADGSIWHWSDWYNSNWMMPSRKPEKFDEVFAGQ